MPANAGYRREMRWVPGVGNGKSLQYSYLENSKDRGAWSATVYEITRVIAGGPLLTVMRGHDDYSPL